MRVVATLHRHDLPTAIAGSGGEEIEVVVLDINKAPGGSPYLAMNALQLFLTDDPNLTGYDFVGTATKIFDLLVPFAGYGFNKSHAAAYSLLAYHTAYLKANYPAEFMAANLTNAFDIAGAVIPNLNDPWVSDGRPDIGAIEHGEPTPHYGLRPIGAPLTYVRRIAPTPTAIATAVSGESERRIMVRRTPSRTSFRTVSRPRSRSGRRAPTTSVTGGR